MSYTDKSYTDNIAKQERGKTVVDGVNNRLDSFIRRTHAMREEVNYLIFQIIDRPPTSPTSTVKGGESPHSISTTTTQYLEELDRAIEQLEMTLGQSRA